MMHILITMAGEGKRFRQAGFTTPKFMLKAKSKTVFEWSLISLLCYFDTANFIFIAKKGDDKFITDRCRRLGIKSSSICHVEKPTSGQAHTAWIASSRLNAQTPVMLYNIDTHIKPEALDKKDIQPRWDGWLLLFEAQGSHWSFADINSDGSVNRVTEKIRISEFASTGLYYFGSASIFNEVFVRHGDEVRYQYGETYIAPFYNFLIERKMKVYSKITASENIIPLGKPSEVLRFDPNFYKRNNVLGPN